MAAVNFDTLKFVRTLEAADLTSRQAEAITNAVRETQEGAQLATKPDLEILKKDINVQIADIRKDMATGFSMLEKTMTIRLGMMIAGAATLIGGMIKFL